MPHVGGGGHHSGGGFHSSHSHSSYDDSTTTSRYGHRHHLHSHYYYRTHGFYCRGRYITYNYVVAIFFFLVSTVLAIISIFLVINRNSYSKNKLENYGLEQYERIYKPHTTSSTYERNILVTFVSYSNQKDYDYICINGDDVNTLVDSCFGSDTSKFGATLASTISQSGYKDDLLSYLAFSLDSVTQSKPYFYEGSYGKPSCSSILNYSSVEYSKGINQLDNAINDFYSKTGYNITFLIQDNTKAYTLDLPLFVFLLLLSGGGIFIGVVSIRPTNKNIVGIEDNVQNGETETNFEDENSFEEY